MRSLLISALLLTSAALAGGSGAPPPATAPAILTTPIEVGQVWEWTLRWTDEASAARQLVEIGSPFPKDSDGVQSFRVQGGLVAIWPGAQYVAVLQDGPINTVCVVRLTRNSAVLSGYAARGTADELNDLVNPDRQVNFDPTDRKIFEAARRAGKGTCALRRLR